MFEFLSKFDPIHKLGKYKSKSLFEIFKLIFQRGGAQGIVFISTIFATKYFLPEDFGLVGLFTSLCSFLALAVSLRFEIKALVCKQEFSYKNFISIAYLSNFIFFLLLNLIFLSLYFLNLVEIWTLLIPLGVFFFCLTQYILPAQNSKIHQLKTLGWMTQIIALITALGQFIGALLFPNFWILILSRLLAWILGGLFMFESIVSGFKNAFRLNFNNIKRIYKCCKKEIFYGVPAALVSVIALQIPAYVYGFFGFNAEIGIYWLAFNLLFMPFIIISTSIRPIFIRYLSSNKVKNKFKFLCKFVFLSLLGGFLFVLIINFIMHLLCLYYLPIEWNIAQSYTLALSFIVVALFSQAGISFGISIFDFQKLNLISNCFQVFSRILGMVAILIYFNDPLMAIWIFSIISFLGYSIYIFYCLYKIRFLKYG